MWLAFDLTFNIQFSFAYDSAADTAADYGIPEPPLNSCTRNAGQECTDNNCGICTDTVYAGSSYHHKNIYANMQWMENNLSPLTVSSPGGAFNHLVLLTSANICKEEDGEHDSNIYGVGKWTGHYASATADYLPKSLFLGIFWTWKPPRVVQHEVSHNYGAVDAYGCSSGQDCVMKPSSSFDA